MNEFLQRLNNGRLVKWAIGYIAAAFAGSIWRLLLKISEDRYQFGGLIGVEGDNPGSPGSVLNHFSCRIKYREIFRPFYRPVREMGHDELLISPLKTAFVCGTPA
jgi:hypothetical protein